MNKKILIIIPVILILILIFSIFKFFLRKDTINFNESLSGIHIYDYYSSCDGFNLFEGKLMDYHGKVYQEFPYKYLGIINNDKYYAQEFYESQNWGIFDLEGKQLFKSDIAIHHEISFDEYNNMLTLTKETHKYKGRLVDFDVILIFDENGNQIDKYSFWDNLDELHKNFPPLALDKTLKGNIKDEDGYMNTTIYGGNFDYFHGNGIKVLPNNKNENITVVNSDGNIIMPFQKGNWLFSARHGSMVMIFDKDTKELVWFINQFSIKDQIQGQHSPTMLENGNILIFDNGRYRKKSRVIEINPLTLNIEWEYKHKNFYSLSQGQAQILPNGNIFITEAEKGHVFELTKDKRIVWEYYHTDKQNETNQPLHSENWGKRQWIYRMTRYCYNE